MKNIKNIFIVAFAFHPQLKSSEGVVNANWFGILQKNTRCFLISAWTTLKYSKNDKSFVNLNSFFLEQIYVLSRSKRKTLSVVLFKIVNKIILSFSRFNLFQNLWIYFQTKQIIKFNSLENRNVFWLRLLPVWPVKTIVIAHKKKAFPLIINCNDPLSVLDNEESDFQQCNKIAQCWTFPSIRLANYFSKKYDLERNRCFVIPHAMRKQEIIFNFNINKNKKLSFLYAGTFYKSAFSESFKQQLTEFGRSEIGKNVEFIFILSQYDKTESIAWLKEALPDVILKFKLERSEVLEYLKKADCILVIDSESHGDLLKGKLVEAFSFGVPVFAVTYKNSVMDLLVNKYGSVCCYQNLEKDVLLKFYKIVENLNSENWRKNFCEQRAQIITLISEEQIFELTNSINNFAFERFLWQQNENLSYPKQPESIDWV